MKEVSSDVLRSSEWKKVDCRLVLGPMSVVGKVTWDLWYHVASLSFQGLALTAGRLLGKGWLSAVGDRTSW